RRTAHGPSGTPCWSPCPSRSRADQSRVLPPPPWSRAPQRRQRRRREPLDPETIVDAALALLDADGLDQLSMRHVARSLDTTAAALYWHVGSKDGLLDL